MSIAEKPPILSLSGSKLDSTPSTTPQTSTLTSQLEEEEEQSSVHSARSASRTSMANTLIQPTSTTISKLCNCSKWLGRTLLQQWFLLGIGVVIALAHSFPNVGRDGGIIHAEWSVNYLLVAIIFFVSGLSLPIANLYKRLYDYKLHLVVQICSFLVFPTVVFAIVSCVRAANPSFSEIDRWALVGMVVVGCVPTTVASNVVMTGQAGGDESAATIEVVLGNTLGVFLTPALLQMFLQGPWSFGAPVASGSGGTGEIYKQVLQQLGYTVFIPLVVGEVLQFIFAQQVQWIRTHCQLAKLASLALLGIIWSTFSGAFYEHVFDTITGGTVAFVLLVDIGLFAVHAILLMLLARHTRFLHISFPSKTSEGERLKRIRPSTPTETLFDVETTIALLFAGSAKGVALGGPIATILYGGQSDRNQALVKLPLVLYQGSQVVAGQGLVVLLRHWKERTLRKEAAAEDERRRIKVKKLESIEV